MISLIAVLCPSGWLRCALETVVDWFRSTGNCCCLGLFPRWKTCLIYVLAETHIGVTIHVEVEGEENEMTDFYSLIHGDQKNLSGTGSQNPRLGLLLLIKSGANEPLNYLNPGLLSSDCLYSCS